MATKVTQLSTIGVPGKPQIFAAKMSVMVVVVVSGRRIFTLDRERRIFTLDADRRIFTIE